MAADRLRVDEQALARFCREHGIRELAFFGSVLREDFTQDSDVDVLVEFEPDAGVSLLDHVRIERELGSLLGRKVDLVTKASLRSPLRERILTSSKVYYVSPRRQGLS